MTKLLHWLTVAALATQLAVGLTMEADAAAERAEEAADAREDAAKDFADAIEDVASSEGGEEAGERAEDAADVAADDVADAEYLVGPGHGVDLIDVHVLLGVSILLLAVVRVWWRRVGGLPPWAAALSARERTTASWIEKALLTCLFLVPGTGLILVFTHDDTLLPMHIAAQVLLGIAVVAHVALVLRHTLLRRDHLLQRMLPGSSTAHVGTPETSTRAAKSERFTTTGRG